ncbi:PorT family protein [Ancylomarina salipaludis]|uniref:PorT family protein n=1 Tax=Ancylomarina salipaludis TaxID=2501299 RepID=A0A4V1MZR7_9BACT|nr:porin family protein [Ancylomarina salipaludis]RXQ88072.1 PorT family protein [Ancylomarina salipaludis]
MKKLLLVAAICLFSSALFAQLSSPISLGVHGGLVSTKLDANMNGASIKENAKNGMMLGVFARININKWYIQPELNYVVRKSETVIAGESYDFKTKTMDIPMLLGYKIVKLPLFKLRAFAGPVASFNIDNSFSQSVKDQFGDPDFKSAVWNGKVGAGVDVWKLTLDVDYEFGLTDVSSEFLKKNKMVNITLGFRFF